MTTSGLLGIYIPKIKTLRAVLLLALTLSAGSLSAQGRVFWQEGGVVVCDSTWEVDQAAAADGSGGIISVWSDKRGDRGVWAQRVDRDGNVVWQRNGVFLRGGTMSPHQFTVVPDGGGGLIAVWYESFAGPYDFQVTAQRVDSSGAVRWGPAGVVVVGTNLGRVFEVSAVSDGRGGILVGWVMTPTESTGVDTLCVQRLDSLGRPCWGSPGLVVMSDTLDIRSPKMCEDGSGGAYIAWSATESSQYRPTVQRADSGGRLLWPTRGIQVLSSDGGPIALRPAHEGYVILCGVAQRIRAQLLDPAG